MAYLSTLIPVRQRVTLRLPHVDLYGDLTYDPAARHLVLIHPDGEHHDLSTDLLVYGYMPWVGETLVKDWTEHSGLTDALVMAGVATVLDRFEVGPFNSRAYRLRVLIPEEGQ